MNYKKLYVFGVSSIFVFLVAVLIPPVVRTRDIKVEPRHQNVIDSSDVVASNETTVVKMTRMIKDDMTENEEELIQLIDDALDNDEPDLLVKIEPLILESSKEIKTEYIEALGWFGEKTMHRLKKYFNDPDEDISTLAIEKWTDSLDEVEDPNLKSVYIREGIDDISNEDVIEDVMMSIDDSDSDLVIVKTLVEIIENSKNEKAVKTAREHYEFATSEKYVDVETAEKWILKNLKDNIDLDDIQQ